MPYIEKYTQRNFEIGPEGATEGLYFGADTAGELNYCLTKVIIAYLEQNGLSYQTCNDIVGALDNAKDEFRRRVQHPYEDKKIKANGDVYPEKYT